MKSQHNTAAWFRYPKYNWKKKHAIVIGAGIAGCQTAWHLVKNGWQVSIIEREAKLAQHASGNPAGVISPKMTAKPSEGEDFYVSCFNYVIKQLATLKQQHHELDWHSTGLLQLAHNSREEKRWETLKLRAFDPDFLQCLDEEKSNDIAGIPLGYKASYFPQAGWINPVSFCETLIKDCADNCNLILETDAIELKKSHDLWTVLNAQKEEVASAEVIIITSGKDLNQFPQSHHLPSLAVAGQTTSAESNPFADQLNTCIGHEGYLTPTSEITSTLTFGASFERDNDAPVLNTETDKINLKQLKTYLPQLADSFTKTHSAHCAVRMTTPDRFPYVGGLADYEFYKENYSDLHQGKHYKDYPNAEYTDGLFTLAGLGSRGLTTSGLLAKSLSDLLNGSLCNDERSNVSNNLRNNVSNDENNDLDNDLNSNLNSDGSNFSSNSILQYCHPARFIIKALKQNKSPC